MGGRGGFSEPENLVRSGKEKSGKEKSGKEKSGEREKREKRTSGKRTSEKETAFPSPIRNGREAAPPDPEG